MNIMTLSSTTLALCLLTSGLQVVSGQTVYNNDFSTSVAEFTTGTGWSLGSGVFNNNFGPLPAATASPAITQISAAGGESFTMTTSFNLVEYVAGTSPGSTLGFAALADNNTLTGDYLLADVNPNNNEFRILSQGGASVGSSGTYTPGFSVGTDYTLTLTGEYSGSDMDMTFSVFNGTSTQSISSTLLASDLSSMGDYFGYRDRVASITGVLDINYDYLTVTVIPEPSSLALLFIALIPLIWLRRRKA